MATKESTGTPSKSDAVREYLSSHATAPVKEIGKALAEQGVDVSIALINKIKYSDRKSTRHRKHVGRRKIGPRSRRQGNEQSSSDSRRTGTSRPAHPPARSDRPPEGRRRHGLAGSSQRGPEGFSQKRSAQAFGRRFGGQGQCRRRDCSRASDCGQATGRSGRFGRGQNGLGIPGQALALRTRPRRGLPAEAGRLGAGLLVGGSAQSLLPRYLVAAVPCRVAPLRLFRRPLPSG